MSILEQSCPALGATVAALQAKLISGCVIVSRKYVTAGQGPCPNLKILEYLPNVPLVVHWSHFQMIMCNHWPWNLSVLCASFSLCPMLPGLAVQELTGHSGGVSCLLHCQHQGRPVMLSAGADFQVKTWSGDGKLLRTSGHHHASVEALAAVPSPHGASMVSTLYLLKS